MLLHDPINNNYTIGAVMNSKAAAVTAFLLTAYLITLITFPKFSQEQQFFTVLLVTAILAVSYISWITGMLLADWRHENVVIVASILFFATVLLIIFGAWAVTPIPAVFICQLLLISVASLVYGGAYARDIVPGPVDLFSGTLPPG